MQLYFLSSRHFFWVSLFASLMLFSRHVSAAGLLEVEEMQKRPPFHTAEKTKRFQKTAPFVSERLSFEEGERVELRGTLEIWYEEHLDDEGNFSAEKMRESFWIRTEDGYAYELLDGESLHQMEPGSIVRIVGIMKQGKINVDSQQDQNIDSSAPETSETFSTSVSGLHESEERAQIGTRRTAVIVFGFQEDTGAPIPFSDSTIRQAIFTGSASANALLQEMSFGQLELVGYYRNDGDIYSGYAIRRSRSVGCEVEESWDEVVHEIQAAAYRDGFRMSHYEHVILLMPYFRDCGWSGLGVVGGTLSALNGTLYIKTIAHEIGHNLGLGHADSLSCNDQGRRTVVGPTCEVREYGDPYDTMGSFPRHFSAFYKARLGWITPQNYTDIRRSGTYFIAPLEMSSNEMQLLRIPLPDGEYYYLDLRKNHGFDAFSDEECFDDVSFPCDVGTKGIMIRKGKGYAQYQRSQLLDLAPESDTFFDSVLFPGQSFQDVANGIEVRTLNVSGTGATVEIALGATVSRRHELYILRETDFLSPVRVIARPGNIDCGDNCFASFSQPTAVLLEAISGEGVTFESLEGALYCSGQESCLLNVEGRKVVIARFRSREPVHLSVSKQGSGTIHSSDNGIWCGHYCSIDYPYGTVTELTALADRGSHFIGWAPGGVCGGSTSPVCRVEMNGDQHAVALFGHRGLTILLHSLTLSKIGSGSGRIVSTPTGIDCGSTCQHQFTENVQVTLNATSDLGSSFRGWRGPCSGNGSCTVMMNQAHTVAAHFHAGPTVTVIAEGNGRGNITSTIGSGNFQIRYGVNCDTTCSASFRAGDQVNLTATPKSGHRLLGWSGGTCSGTGTCSFTMGTPVTIRARFEE